MKNAANRPSNVRRSSETASPLVDCCRPNVPSFFVIIIHPVRRVKLLVLLLCLRRGRRETRISRTTIVSRGTDVQPFYSLSQSPSKEKKDVVDSNGEFQRKHASYYNKFKFSGKLTT